MWPSNSRLRPNFYAVSLGALGTCVFVGIWWAASIKMGIAKVPAPRDVFWDFFEVMQYNAPLAASSNTSTYLPHLLYTVRMTLLSSAAGIVLGVMGGVLVSWHSGVRDFLKPPLEVLRLTPSLVVVPFLIMWFGTSAWAQFGLVAFYSYIFIQVSTINAISNLDPVYWRFAATQGASHRQIYLKVVVPAITPSIAGAARVVVATAWGLEFLAEQIGAQQGLGRVAATMFILWRTDLLLTAILWVAVVGLVTDQLLYLLFRYITRWQPSGEPGR